MVKRSKDEVFKRYIFLFIGLLINAFGVVLMTKSCLGTSPVASIPYVLSNKFPISLGSFTFAFYFVMFLVQLAILRKNIKLTDCIQLPLSIIYSFFIDICVSLVSSFTPKSYILMLITFLSGCVFRAMGVSIQVAADEAMLSSEAFMIVISRAVKKDFSLVKLIADGLMTVIAIILSFVFFGKLLGIREGTILAAILTAPIARVFSYVIDRFTKDNISTASISDDINKIRRVCKGGLPLIITVSSQSGSGGHYIARELSKELKIPLYDNELIDLINENGDFPEGYVKSHMERIYTNRFWEFFTRNYNYVGYSLESYEPLFEAQTKVIKDIAAKGSSIIVGYCSEYILRDRENVISIYIHADEETKLQFLKHEYQVHDIEARNIMKVHDHERAVYFKYFTGEEWAISDRFSITVDSSLLGIGGTTELLKNTIQSFLS